MLVWNLLNMLFVCSHFWEVPQFVWGVWCGMRSCSGGTYP
jgi:hypothetical protein